jgi:hypothetical protein
VRVGLIATFLLLAGIAPSQMLWAPQVQAIFSTVVQTAGALVLAVAALRLAPVSADAPVASAAGR